MTITNEQLQAAFLAAREQGKILDDDVLRAVIIAAREVEQRERADKAKAEFAEYQAHKEVSE